jgi:lysophospholipase L1-like esterase
VKDRLANDLSILGLFAGPRFFCLMIGSNDLGNDPTQTPVSVYSAIQSIISQVIAETGARCVVCTIPTGNFTLAGTPAEFEVKRLALNQMIVDGTNSTPAYIVADIGVNSTIGQNLQPDGIHPTYAGQEIAAAILARSLSAAGLGS